MKQYAQRPGLIGILAVAGEGPAPEGLPPEAKATDGEAVQIAEARLRSRLLHEAIHVGNQCLKCHVPQRTSLEDRKAAVVISMPLNLRELTEK